MSNIRGLKDLGNSNSRPDRGSDSGEESDGGEQQPFYVGGSEHSGQEVLGPPRRGPRDPTEALFEDARRHGAEGMQPAEHAATRNGAAPSSSARFPGGGVKLTDSAPAAAAAQSSGSESDGDVPDVVIVMNVWENGFSIDDGPLRDLESPESAAFLGAIRAGRVPPELVTAHPRQKIDLRMVRKPGPYEAPKMRPFGGSGARLGAVVPVVLGAPSSSAVPTAAPAQQNQQEAANNLAAAQAAVALDAGAPTTQIQVRLSNGQRLVGKFNHNHTIAVVRDFIVAAQPELAFAPFELMTTFPNKVVEDESLSLADAGVLNAVVVVKPVA